MRGAVIRNRNRKTRFIAAEISTSDFFACTDFGSDEPGFTVTEQEVFMKLSKVNPAKANGPDGIPS